MNQADKAALKAISEILENNVGQNILGFNMVVVVFQCSPDTDTKQQEVKARLGNIKRTAFEKGLHLFQISIEDFAALHTPSPGGKNEERSAARKSTSLLKSFLDT